jgi:hypothetical protein
MELHRIFFTAKGLQTLAIQTLRLKGEVHILLICLLQGILSLIPFKVRELQMHMRRSYK